MAITDYIPKDKLTQEGFIHVSDTDAVMRVTFDKVPDIIDIRLDVPDIAKLLNVSIYRLKGYITDNRRVGVWILDNDDRLSLGQIIKTDWSRLKGQKRTPKLHGSNFEGRKRKITKNHTYENTL